MGLRTKLRRTRKQWAAVAAAVLATSMAGPIGPAIADSCSLISYSDTSFPLYANYTCSFRWGQELDRQMTMTVHASAVGSSVLARVRADILDPRGRVLMFCETPDNDGYDISPAWCTKTASHFTAGDGEVLRCRVIAEAPSGLGVIFLHGHWGCAWRAGSRSL